MSNQKWLIAEEVGTDCTHLENTPFHRYLETDADVQLGPGRGFVTSCMLEIFSCLSKIFCDVPTCMRRRFFVGQDRLESVTGVGDDRPAVFFDGMNSSTQQIPKELSC